MHLTNSLCSTNICYNYISTYSYEIKIFIGFIIYLLYIQYKHKKHISTLELTIKNLTDENNMFNEHIESINNLNKTKNA